MDFLLRSALDYLDQYNNIAIELFRFFSYTGQRTSFGNANVLV